MRKINVMLTPLMFLQILVGCLTFSYVSTARTESSVIPEMPGHSCDSISGMYVFFGQDEGGDFHRRPLIDVLFGTQLFNGRGAATELGYDSANNLLHVRIHRVNLAPDPDFSVKVQCTDGVVIFEDARSGHADGSSYELQAIFRFSKDNGALVVHQTYEIKSTNVGFFWKKRTGETITRFKALNGSPISRPVSSE